MVVIIIHISEKEKIDSFLLFRRKKKTHIFFFKSRMGVASQKRLPVLKRTGNKSLIYLLRVNALRKRA